MRELLQQALEALKEARDTSIFLSRGEDSRNLAAIEAIEAALSRSKWVKVADGLPVVPEGEKYVVVWGWSSLYRDAPALKRWYPDMTEETTLNTHWQYRQDDTPAPPEDV